LRVIVLQLPLRDPQDNRKVRRGTPSACLYHFYGKAGSAGQAAAIAVFAPVGLAPQKLVYQIAMGAMQRDSIAAHMESRFCRRAEGFDDGFDLRERGRLPEFDGALAHSADIAGWPDQPISRTG
jgi:hypothetical protein